jgi:TonB family protein
MPRSSAGHSVAAVLLLVVAAPACVVAAAVPPTVGSGIANLADWDRVTQQLRRVAWSAHSTGARLPDAPDGRTAADYVDRWLLPDDIEAELVELRQSAAEAERGGDTASVSRLLAEATPILELQMLRAYVIQGVWQDFARVQMQDDALRPLLARASAAERASVQERVDTLAPQLQAALDSALVAGDRTSLNALFERAPFEINRILDSYNEERLRLVAVLDAESPPAVIPLVWTRDTPCPARVTTTSGRTDPTFDKSVTLEPPYPDEARRAGFSATIVLAVDVSATGCLERVAIASSSGTRLLDQTALDWARLLRYLPGERDGRPEAGSTHFAVTFRLTDDGVARDELAPFSVLPGSWDPLGPEFCQNPGVIAFSADRRAMTLTTRSDVRAPGTDGMAVDRYAVLEAANGDLHVTLENESDKDADGKPVTWHIVLLDHTRFCWRRNDESPRTCSAPAVRRCPDQ